MHLNLNINELIMVKNNLLIQTVVYLFLGGDWGCFSVELTLDGTF